MLCFYCFHKVQRCQTLSLITTLIPNRIFIVEDSILYSIPTKFELKQSRCLHKHGGNQLKFTTATSIISPIRWFAVENVRINPQFLTSWYMYQPAQTNLFSNVVREPKELSTPDLDPFYGLPVKNLFLTRDFYDLKPELYTSHLLKTKHKSCTHS